MPEQLYKTVDGKRVPLTEEETAARLEEESAWLAKQPTTEQREQIAAATAQSEAAFESLPKGKQALLSGIRVGVRAALESGNLSEAREILETAPANLYEGSETDRQAFLALLPRP